MVRTVVQMRSSALEYFRSASGGAGAGWPQRCRSRVKISTSSSAGAALGAEGGAERLAHGVEAQRAVALELRLVEELVARGLMGKGRVLGRVAEDIGRLVAGERRLDVEQRPRRERRAVGVARVEAVVPDGANRAVAFAAAGDGRQLAQIDLDVHAEVGAAPLDGVAEVLEGDVAVLPGIAGDDEPAAAPHQFVEAQVLEVAAVGEIHPLLVVGRHAEQLVEQLAQRQVGGLALPHGREARVAQPPAEPDVEDRHQEGQRGRRVVAHVGRGGGAGGGDGQPHGDRPGIVRVLARTCVGAEALHAGGPGRRGDLPAVVLLLPHRRVLRGACRHGLPLGGRVVVVAVFEPAVLGREDERCRLALLPREVLARHQVDGGVEDRIRPHRTVGRVG